MKIETERLELVALTAAQMKRWIEDITALEKELRCVYSAEPLEGWFLDIVQGQMIKTQADEENYMWHSFWFLIRKSDRQVVGLADFKDTPDGAGQVEIGYGLGSCFEHQGYMGEAIKAMCAWAFGRPGVSSIVAETEAENAASQRLLTRCGFTEEKRENTVWFRLRKD